LIEIGQNTTARPIPAPQNDALSKTARPEIGFQDAEFSDIF
jgi:hypothetical protein